MRHKLIRRFIIVLAAAAVGAIAGAIVGFATTSPYDEFRDLEALGIALFGAFIGAAVSLFIVSRAAVGVSPIETPRCPSEANRAERDGCEANLLVPGGSSPANPSRLPMVAPAAPLPQPMLAHPHDPFYSS